MDDAEKTVETVQVWLWFHISTIKSLGYVTRKPRELFRWR